MRHLGVFPQFHKGEASQAIRLECLTGLSIGAWIMELTHTNAGQ
jgi:hypothetical protein